MTDFVASCSTYTFCDVFSVNFNGFLLILCCSDYYFLFLTANTSIVQNEALNLRKSYYLSKMFLSVRKRSISSFTFSDA